MLQKSSGLIMEIKRGIIVSIQGYARDTTQELALNAESGGAVAIRTDKPVRGLNIPIIGLSKKKVPNLETTPYITTTIESIDFVHQFSDFVAIDYRVINKDLKDLSEYCKEEKIPVIADIRGGRCLNRIIEEGFYFTYISTTFGVFDNKYRPDIKFLETVNRKFPGQVIAEGGYSTRAQIGQAYKAGAVCVCIGGAISNTYKLTQKFSSVPLFDNGTN